jgi:hypothetical protein
MKLAGPSKQTHDDNGKSQALYTYVNDDDDQQEQEDGHRKRGQGHHTWAKKRKTNRLELLKKQ